MRLRRLVPVSLTAVLLAVPSAAHSQNSTAGLWSLAPDGNPLIGVGLPVDLDELRACPPGGACETVNVRDLPVEPGAAASGTVFEADLFGVTERSRPWQGQLAQTLAPTMAGTLAIGGTITPTAGRWSGGWPDDYSVLRLHVCRTAAGEECVHGSGTLTASQVGWYVFAVDTRTAATATVPKPPPEGAPFALPASATTVAFSAPAGPIASRAQDAPRIVPPTGAGGNSPTQGGGTTKPKAPKVTLRKRVLRKGARVTVGSITCAVRCKVKLSVADGRRTLTRNLSVRGTAQLAIVKGSKLRKTVRLRVTVTVDGRRLANRRVVRP